MKLICVFLISLLMPAFALASGSAHDHGRHSHSSKDQAGLSASSSAHVHGQLSMMIVLDADILQIEIESPAANLLGFEHQAQTNSELAKVSEVKTKLLTKTLFKFNGAACTAKLPELNLSSVMHQSKPSDKHNHETVHQDIHLTYTYTCENAEVLSSVDVYLFEFFPGIERINSQWLAHGRQGASELSAAKQRIQLR